MAYSVQLVSKSQINSKHSEVWIDSNTLSILLYKLASWIRKGILCSYRAMADMLQTMISLRQKTQTAKGNGGALRQY